MTFFIKHAILFIKSFINSSIGLSNTPQLSSISNEGDGAVQAPAALTAELMIKSPFYIVASILRYQPHLCRILNLHLSHILYHPHNL